MRSTFKVLFYVNGSKEKNGIVPIMGRVTINGSVGQFSISISVPSIDRFLSSSAKVVQTVFES